MNRNAGIVDDASDALLFTDQLWSLAFGQVLMYLALLGQLHVDHCDM